eukprot:g16743.t2
MRGFGNDDDVPRTYAESDNDNDNIGNQKEFFYLGMTSSDTMVVAVDEERIMRYQRDTSNGDLDFFDDLALSSITAAAADVTGDYLVTVNQDYYIEVTRVGDSIGEGQMDHPTSFSNPGGSSLIKGPTFIAVSPNNVGIYIQGRNEEIVLMNSFDSGGALTLGTSYAVEVDPGNNGYTFVTIHPDGTWVYALNQATGILSEYSRDSIGSLTHSCSVGTGILDKFNVILAYGPFVFVADGDSIHTYEALQTPAPTPAPTPFPTPAPTTPAPTTPSPTTPAPTTPAPTTSAPTTPAPTTPAPITPAPTTPAPTTPAPTTSAPTTPAPTTPAPTRGPSPSPTRAAPPALLPEAPTLLSAALSDTQSAFTLTFSSICYCSEDVVGGDVFLCGFNAISGNFDNRCDIHRVLDEDTLSIFGNQSTTCEWSSDSKSAAIFYDEAYDPLVAGMNITLAGGYILGEISTVLYGVEYATGTVELEGRTPAPELLQAQFTDDGAYIMVYFSLEGSPSSGLIDADDAESGNGPGPCDALLSVMSIPPLGHGALCEWTGGRELKIHLGYEAYIIPDTSYTDANSTVPCQDLLSCITLLEGGVRTEAFAVLSSAGSIAVMPPENPPAVTAILVAPQVVGLCGSLRLDGRTSSGAASRPLSTSWSVSTPASADVLSVVKSSLASFDGSLLAELNATMLAIGVEFTFSLTVETFLGEADEAIANVTRTGEDIPSVAVLGPATRSVTRARSTSLRMVASPPACGQSQSLTFNWSEVGGPGFDNLGDAVFQALEMRDATTLLLPAYTLGYPGSSYLFAATTTSQSSLQSSSTTVEVFVEQGALRAVIQGGNFFQHMAGRDLALDGSFSLDEDKITELPMRYDWWCSQNCTSSASFSTEAVASIPAQELVSGTIYEFSLNVSKGSIGASDNFGILRSDTARVNVQVVSYDAPEVVLVAKDDSPKHDGNKKTVIYGTVDQASDLLWTQVQGDLDVEGQDWSMFFTTSQTGSNLVIRPGVLTGGASYTFRLSAVDTASQNAGFAELSINVNTAPLGGHVEASPRAGTAAIDTFLLQSLDWTDDDLPLLYSFAYTKEETELLSLSMLATEQPEWEGPLPLGAAADNYTMRISGQISDSFGATAIATSDASGEVVSVQVMAWAASAGGTALSDAYAAALSEVGDTPGVAASTVRAYASLLANELEDASEASAEEIELYQNLTTTMVKSVATDFNALEYSPTTAGAVFDTLALVSVSEVLLRADVQDELLSVSSDVLQLAVDDGTWDPVIFTPALELLENVMSGYNSSPAGVVGTNELGEQGAATLPVVVNSMASLMESGLEDGEDSMIISNSYISILCLVTSQTGALNVDTGVSSVAFSEGSIDASVGRRSRRRMAAGETDQAPGLGETPTSRPRGRRRLDSVLAASTSTIIVTDAQFNINDSPSSAIDAGATSITVTSTGGGEEIVLSAPVRMTLRASAAVASKVVPSCVYFNENAGSWDTAGLATDSIAISMDEGDDGNGRVNVIVSCLSFHLSDFTISSDEVDAAFRPVTLTAGFDVVLQVRDISNMGIALLLMVLILLAVVRTTSTIADSRSNLARQLILKTDAWYIATGEAHHPPSLMEVSAANSSADAHQSHRRRRGTRARRQKRMLWPLLARRFRRWGRSVKGFLRLVLRYHPWFAILSPSSSNLTLTREQLSLLIFAQILVHMTVEAAIIGNSTNYKIQVVQILVSITVSLPASIIIPRLFAAVSAPPPAPATHLSDTVVPSKSGDWDNAKQVEDAKAQAKSSRRWLGEPNPLMAVLRLISSTISSTGSRAPVGPGGQRYSDDGALARGTKLLWSGLRHMSLDVVCVIDAVLIGIGDQLDKALLVTTVACLLVDLLCLDAVLATRGSSFTIMNFKMLFVLVFARMVITALQIVLSFHAVRNRSSSMLFYAAMFAISVVKLVGSHKDELMPCMDGINQTYVSQVAMAKKYRPVRRIHQQIVTSPELDVNGWRRAAAIKIQTFVRMHQARQRAVRLQEVVVWHSPDVEHMRKKLKFRTYACLAIYTLVIAWINICYVATYDTPAVRSWVAATGLTVLADVLLRKPLSVLAIATFHAIRDNVRVPETAYVGIGISQRPIGTL